MMIVGHKLKLKREKLDDDDDVATSHDSPFINIYHRQGP